MTVRAVPATDERFRAAVETLRVPAMGTDAVAPLLHALLKLVRPQRVLEVGMGYTTPFLASALSEIAEETQVQAQALAAKTRPYLDGGTPLDDEWIYGAPALLAPEFDNFWDLINPDGGLVVMHYLMTSPEGEAFLRYLSAQQEMRPGEFEVVNLLEPHKLSQNSLTILRRTSGVVPRRYAKPGARMDYGERLRSQAEAQAVAHAAPIRELTP
jgi:hypothetical protein